MKNLEEVRNELVGREYSIVNLSIKLLDLGFQDIYWFEDWEELLSLGYVIVEYAEEWEGSIKICFEEMFESSEDEDVRASIIEITDILEN